MRKHHLPFMALPYGQKPVPIRKVQKHSRGIIMSNKRIKTVSFTAWLDGKARTFIIKGKAATTLFELAKSGNKGLTALELSNTWAVRLGAYIHDLRHKCGLDIVTQREKHEDGWHGRYVLITPVEILEAK